LQPFEGVEVDEAFVRRAVDLAESNALRTALYHATGDPEVRDYEQVEVVLRNGALKKLVISDDDLPKLEEKAVQFLLDNAGSFQEAEPDDAKLKELMQMSLGRELEYGDLFENFKDTVGFGEYPLFRARWTDDRRPELPGDFSVAIIGSGFSGLSTAVQLGLLGIPYTVYERRSEVGGTWSINRYLDVRVDTMSTSYQLSFVKKYPWKEFFARGAEVREYIDHVTLQYGVADHLKLGHDVTKLTWNEETSTWDIVVRHGDQEYQTSASVVVAATGLFNKAKKLDIPGIDDFRGELPHTARWPEDLSLEGKRVAVIGNGSTGVQLLSRVAEEAAHVDVFVRSPQWISPREYYGESVPVELRWLLQNMPYYWNWDRFAWSTGSGSLQDLFVPDPEWKAQGGYFSKGNDFLRAGLTAYILDQLEGDEELAAKITPEWPPWARRMIVDNNWYKTLLRDNVDLVMEPIDHIEADAIVRKDGTRHEADVIVSASGFEVTDYLFPIEVRGRGGLGLKEKWERDGVGPRAFQSMTVPGFPNLFILYGPNSQGAGAGGSLIGAMQIWATYVSGCVVELLESGRKSFEVKEDVFEEHYKLLDDRNSKMIWMDPDSKDRNYYVSHGRVQVMAAWAPQESWDHYTRPRLTENYLVK